MLTLSCSRKYKMNSSDGDEKQWSEVYTAVTIIGEIRVIVLESMLLLIEVIFCILFGFLG